jgi:glycerol-3-phosphate acyltransferase PlsY
MNLTTLALVALGAYLCGSIPFGYILVRIFYGIDVRSIGSGNIGATNVARTGGKKIAILTLVLDSFKGWLPVHLILHHLHAATPAQLNTYAAVAAFCCLLGHMFPVWLRFKGGKGVATGLGVFLALAPKVALLAFALFLLVVAVTRYVSLGSVLACAVFPLGLWWLTGDRFTAPALAISAAAALLVILRHHQNIARLLAGTENRLGAKKGTK